MMITYKLNTDGTYAGKHIDGFPTGEWANVETNTAYLVWIEEGNVPTPADEPN
jgi:hypothetical protein